MTNKLKFWYRLDQNGIPIPGTLERRATKPTTGKWKELAVIDPCCDENDPCPPSGFTLRPIQVDSTGICADAFDLSPYVYIVFESQDSLGMLVLPISGAEITSVNIPSYFTGNVKMNVVVQSNDYVIVEPFDSSHVALAIGVASTANTSGITGSQTSVFNIDDLDNITFSCSASG